jgi:disulfide bond formation protein DsbB
MSEGERFFHTGGRRNRGMNDYLALARNDPPRAAAAIVALVGLVTIGGFFFFQYGMGLPPCPLCLEQRISYYVTVPLAALLWLGAGHGATRKVMVLGFLAIAAVMLWNAGLAGYHAGVEWKLWLGPQDCSGPINNFGSAQDLLKQLKNISLVRCDVASWRFLGLSLAGWDVPVSLALAGVALWGAKFAFMRPAGDR